MSLVTLILWLLTVLPSSFGSAILPILATSSILENDDSKQTVETQTGDQPMSQNTHIPKATIENPSGTLFTDTTSNAVKTVNALSDPQQKLALAPIATTPTGIWQTKNSDQSEFAEKMAEATRLGHIPIVVLYNIPNIGCGSSGAGTFEEYKAWIDARTPALTGTRSIVIIEPDAVAMFNCLTQEQLETRKIALNYAVDAIAATGSTPYLDAGHAKWVDAETMVQRLLDSGLARSRGIAVNVSNYQTNELSEEYAQKVLDLSGIAGLGVVIDTSRNGNGPPANQQWCNAQGVRLGTPSTLVKNGVVDAYLWVKVPGESDGAGPNCSDSPVSEGQFWLEYAQSLLN